MTKVNYEHIVELLPEINDIRNEELREKVCSIWQEAVDSSNWEDMDNIKFNSLCPGAKLVHHTRAVTQATVAILTVLKENCGADFDKDTALVEGLLHDVCKVMEYDPAPDNLSTKNKIGKTIQHGFFSGYYGQKYGLSTDIVASLVAHTSHSRMIPATLEGIVLFYADMACADMYRFQAGAPLKISEYK